MKSERQLELQAYLDGELSAHAARRVADWMAKDPEAQALAAELKMTRTVLAGNEPERTVPESREFYWSKIQRAIEAAGSVERKPDWGWLFAWRRYLVPVSGVALVAVLAITLARFSPVVGAGDTQLAEVENLSEHISSHAFQSRGENTFVVWISPQDQGQDEGVVTEEDDIIVQ